MSQEFSTLAAIVAPRVLLDAIETLWAYNPSNGWAILITVYRPDPARWID